MPASWWIPLGLCLHFFLSFFFFKIFFGVDNYFLKTLLNLLQYCFCFTFWFIWPCDMWDLSSPTRNWTCTPCTGRQSLNHWTTREVPLSAFHLEKKPESLRVATGSGPPSPPSTQAGLSAPWTRWSRSHLRTCASTVHLPWDMSPVTCEAPPFGSCSDRPAVPTPPPPCPSSLTCSLRFHVCLLPPGWMPHVGRDLCLFH